MHHTVHGALGVAMVTVQFHGVRGSTPSPCTPNERYGGNTACVSLQSPGQPVILFDLGTGLRNLGAAWPKDEPFDGVALVSHLHWDHIQGLPFFEPILRAGSKLQISGPRSEGLGIKEAFQRFMCRPFFPVTIDDLAGVVEFTDREVGSFSIGDAKVTVAEVPHVGMTLGYRVELGGVSVAYVSDHQQPGIDDFSVDAGVIELCQGVDLLIHDAQYDAASFAAKSTWGHCTVDYAVAVGHAAQVKKLALFHHDPAHDDQQLDELLAQARTVANRASTMDVILATEGMSLTFTS